MKGIGSMNITDFEKDFFGQSYQLVLYIYLQKWKKKEKAISINPQKSLNRNQLPRELTSNILRLISTTYNI